MTIEQATLEREIDQAYTERQLLGLDAWLNSLSPDDRQIIRLVYEDGYSYQAAAPMVNMSKPGLQYRINKICKNSIRV
nr:sigma factor-like helix-turn-helix DNA-binding protein [Holdemania sp. 1001302B_160321_E10]